MACNENGIDCDKIMMINAGAWYPRYNVGRPIWPRPHPRWTRCLSRRRHQVHQTVYIEDGANQRVLNDLLRIAQIIEYWIIYRGLGFLAVRWFGSSPTFTSPPSSSQQVVSLSQSSYVSPVELTDGIGGGWGGRGAKLPNLTNREKAFPSINLSILSG